MFSMACGAVRREHLVRMVKRPIVASPASLIAGFRAETAGFFHMARAASLGQYRMACGHFPAAVNTIVAVDRKPSQPDQRQSRHANRQKETQTPKRMRP